MLNSTGITGLAKRVAADVEAGGWTVTKTANWTGARRAVDDDLLPAGRQEQGVGEAVREEVRRRERRSSRRCPGMTSNLTLVLTRDAA